MVDFTELKRFFMFTLIGSLIVCALVAVITVLVGNFNEVTGKVLFTLFMVVVHSLVSLAFIWNNERQHTFDKLEFFINVLFIIIVLSFLTSIFGIWDLISEEMVSNLYATYFVIGFASLHGDILSKALNKEGYIDIIIYLNYVFMAIVVLMLMPVIYIDNATNALGEFYFRALGAAGIIDGTLSILTIIFYRLYMNKHPKAESPLENSWQQSQTNVKAERKGLSIWVWILIIYLVAQIILPLLFFGFRNIF
ncbi:MAG: hypothetical protein AABW80_04880 [Nanoarchaeota archaeon]